MGIARHVGVAIAIPGLGAPPGAGLEPGEWQFSDVVLVGPVDDRHVTVQAGRPRAFMYRSWPGNCRAASNG